MTQKKRTDVLYLVLPQIHAFELREHAEEFARRQPEDEPSFVCELPVVMRRDKKPGPNQKRRGWFARMLGR